MEEALSRALRFLPQVNNCCVCIKNMKIATMISSIVLYIFHNSPPFYQTWSYMSYHHKASAIAIIQCIVWYIFIILSVLTFVLNVIVFFTLCIDMNNVWGLLFVLVSLLGIMFDCVWTVLVFIRHWVDPGLRPHYIINRTRCPANANRSHVSKFDDLFSDLVVLGNSSCYELSHHTDYIVLSRILPLLLYVYFLIVINSFYRESDSDDESD